MRSPSPPPDLIKYNELLHAIAKYLHPDPIDAPDLPGVVGKRSIDRKTKVWSKTTDLTAEDQAHLRELVIKHVGALPPLRAVMSRRQMLTFRRAFLKLEHRPEWEPVLRTELDIERLRHSRGDARRLHDAALKDEIAQGRVRHFDSDRIPAVPHFERITYLPWEDAQAYLAAGKLDLQLVMYGPPESPIPIVLSHEDPTTATPSASDAPQAEKRKYRAWSPKSRDQLIEWVAAGQTEVAAAEFGIPATYAKQLASRFKREAENDGLRATRAGSHTPLTDHGAPTLGGSSAAQNLDNENLSRGTKAPPLPPILRIWEVEKLIRLKRSTIYAYLNEKSKYYDPSFPRPVSLSGAPLPREKKRGSGGAIGFYTHEIEQWLAARPKR